MWPSLREKVFTVASPSIIAATISPLLQSFCARITTKSPSQIAASTMESPTTLSMNSSPSPTMEAGKGRSSSTFCSANIGPPAAMRPTRGTLCVRSGEISSNLSSGVSTSSARPREGSLRIQPFASRASSWYFTLDGEARPAASPISRIEGG